MSAIVLDQRPGGIIETLHDGRAIGIEQDVTDILELCRLNRTENDRFRGFRKIPEFQHVASIPLALVEIVKAKGMDILNDEEAMRAFLNNPENDVFRTSGGRV